MLDDVNDCIEKRRVASNRSTWLWVSNNKNKTKFKLIRIKLRLCYDRVRLCRTPLINPKHASVEIQKFKSGANMYSPPG